MTTDLKEGKRQKSQGGGGKDKRSNGAPTTPSGRRQSITATTLQKLEIREKHIEITKWGIGRGAFGDVHLAKWNGVDVAVKQLTQISEER